jgi:peptidoglycan/xylan/chitin deacetylase (PgdA/CDA1 family)
LPVLRVRLVLLPMLLLMLAACRPIAPVAPPSTAEPSAAEPTAAEPTASPSAPGQTTTELETLEVWTPDGLAPGLTVAGEAEGSCWVGSLVASTSRAWRCSVEAGEIAQIYDPCFENRFDPAAPLACVGPDAQVLLLTLTEPLPREVGNLDATDRLPVRLVLASGDDCGLTTGASITVAGQRVNYFCTSGGVLLGEPDTSSEPWTILYSAEGYPRTLDAFAAVDIAEADLFAGDTANRGVAPTLDADAQHATLLAIESTPSADNLRLTFRFSDAGTPPLEVGYVNEPAIDPDTGATVDVAGERRLRVLFFNTRLAPALDAEVEQYMLDHPDVLEIVETDSTEGSVALLIGVGTALGFEVNVLAEEQSVVLDLFASDETFDDAPELGVGSEGPTVEAVQTLLESDGFLAQPYLTGIYDEPTRRAVVALEEANGLVPDGVVGPEVWAILLRDQSVVEGDEEVHRGGRPLLSPARGVGLQTQPSVTPAGAEVFVRAGPGLDYAPVTTLAPGEQATVIGLLTGAEPANTWYQVQVQGTAGWVRADVVTLSGGLEGVPQVAPPPTPTPPPPPDPATLGAAPPAATGPVADRPTTTADGRPILYLTFDDGPQPGSTPTMLDLLQRYSARGTFFSIGYAVQSNGDISRRTVADGSSVENHTLNHASLDTLSTEQFFNEVETTQSLIQQATGTLPLCLRPPYGATDARTRDLAADLGLEVVLWEIDTQDWRRPGVDAIVSHVLRSVYPGAIVLMHDGGGDRSQSVAALEQILAQLSAKGYVFAALCG